MKERARWRNKNIAAMLLATGIVALLAAALRGWRPARFLPAPPRFPLHDAIERNQIAEARRLLEAEPDLINSRRLGSMTPLHVAAQFGRRDMVELLLHYGAVVNAPDLVKTTPLHCAARSIEKGDVGVVELLLRHGADARARDDYGRTPLCWAAGLGRNFSIEHLLRAGGDINTKDRDDKAPIHRAIAAGHLATAELLAARGATLDPKNLHTRALLHWTVETDRALLLDWLLGVGADPDSRDKDRGRSPLHVAALRGNLSAAQLLARKGANLNLRDNRGHTPLLLAAMNEDPGGIIAWLRESGAEVGLREAAALGDLARVETLAQTRAEELHEETVIGWGALYCAAFNGHKAVVERLLALGATVHARDEHRLYTPLHGAVVRGHTEICATLLAAGADLHARGKNGWTPLHRAIWFDQAETAEFLIERGADPKAPDESGVTPMELKDGTRFPRLMSQARLSGEHE